MWLGGGQRTPLLPHKHSYNAATHLSTTPTTHNAPAEQNSGPAHGKPLKCNGTWAAQHSYRATCLPHSTLTALPAQHSYHKRRPRSPSTCTCTALRGPVLAEEVREERRLWARKRGLGSTRPLWNPARVQHQSSKRSSVPRSDPAVSNSPLSVHVCAKIKQTKQKNKRTKSSKPSKKSCPGSSSKPCKTKNPKKTQAIPQAPASGELSSKPCHFCHFPTAAKNITAKQHPAPENMSLLSLFSGGLLGKLSTGKSGQNQK